MLVNIFSLFGDRNLLNIFLKEDSWNCKIIWQFFENHYYCQGVASAIYKENGAVRKFKLDMRGFLLTPGTADITWKGNRGDAQFNLHIHSLLLSQVLWVKHAE